MAASTSQNRCVFVGNIPYDATEEQLIQICEEVGPVVSFRQIVRCDMPKEGILNVAWINRRLSRATLAAAFEHTKHRIRGKGVIPEEIYYVKLVSKDTKSWTNLRRDALFLLPYEFRLVTDRETGKPKGYGFCEYKDEETALSARRNLLGYEINGRQLRVDFAENDKGADKNREQGRGGPGMATANVDPQKQVGGPAILVDSAHQQPIGLSLATAAGSIMAGALGGAQTSRNANLNPVYSQGVHGVDPLTLHLAQMSRAQLNDIFSELKVMATENKELARQLLLANPQLPKALFQAQIMLGMVTPQMMANIQQRGSLLPQVPEDNQHDLPPVAQNKMQFGIMPTIQEGQPSAVPPQRVSQVQMPNEAPIHFQQPLFPAQSGVSSIDPNLLSSFLARPQVNATGSSYLNQQTQVPSLQHSGMYGTVHSGHDRQLVNPNEAFPPRLIRPPESDPGYKAMRNTSDRLGQATIDTNLVQRTSNYSNLTTVSSKRPSMVADNSEPRPSEQIKLNGRKETVLGSSQVLGLGSSVNKILIPQNQPPEPEASQVQLPTEVESALLQQVMNLTPEQLSLLPPDQKQQVLQLQQMLR